MAQKVVGLIKLQIPAGKATPAPPVGPALGQHGVNIMAFTKEFNERTKNDAGLVIPVVITVFEDRSFTFITKTPPRQPFLLRRHAVLTRLQVFLTRIRLQQSLRLRFSRLLKQRCLTSMQQILKQQ